MNDDLEKKLEEIENDLIECSRKIYDCPIFRYKKDQNQISRTYFDVLRALSRIRVLRYRNAKYDILNEI